MPMMMSPLVTCGERQPASNEIANKTVSRSRLGGAALSEIEVMRCIVSSWRFVCVALSAKYCIIRALSDTSCDGHHTVGRGNRLDTSTCRHGTQGTGIGFPHHGSDCFLETIGGREGTKIG